MLFLIDLPVNFFVVHDAANGGGGWRRADFVAVKSESAEGAVWRAVFQSPPSMAPGFQSPLECSLSVVVQYSSSTWTYQHIMAPPLHAQRARCRTAYPSYSAASIAFSKWYPACCIPPINPNILQDFELAAWQLTYLCLAPKRV